MDMPWTWFPSSLCGKIDNRHFRPSLDSFLTLTLTRRRPIRGSFLFVFIISRNNWLVGGNLPSLPNFHSNVSAPIDTPATGEPSTERRKKFTLQSPNHLEMNRLVQVAHHIT